MAAIHAYSRKERDPAEQRANTRYKLTLELSYGVISGSRCGEVGNGQTIDMSSVAVRFTAERPLCPGLYIEVALDWPMLLDGRIPLQLIANGIVVRTNGLETVIHIEQYAFKTRRRASADVERFGPKTMSA